MGLRQSLREDTVGSLPLREVITVLPDSKVRQAIEKMIKKNIGCVVIVDEYDRPVGKFTERIMIRKLVSMGSAILDEPIKDHMIEIAGCVKINDPVEKVLEYMRNTGLRFVCVTDEAGQKIVALTGQKGSMEYIADHFPRAVKTQLMDSKLFMDEREGA